MGDRLESQAFANYLCESLPPLRLRVSARALCVCSLLRREFRRELQAEIITRVGETDVFHHRADELVVVRNFAARHIATEEIAQRAPEIFVPRITDEAARIGDHAHE